MGKGLLEIHPRKGGGNRKIEGDARERAARELLRPITRLSLTMVNIS